MRLLSYQCCDDGYLGAIRVKCDCGAVYWHDGAACNEKYECEKCGKRFVIEDTLLLQIK